MAGNCTKCGDCSKCAKTKAKSLSEGEQDAVIVQETVMIRVTEVELTLGGHTCRGDESNSQPSSQY